MGDLVFVWPSIWEILSIEIPFPKVIVLAKVLLPA